MAEYDAKIAEIKASITARFLPMIAPFVAKNDIRYYLCGVNVRRAPEHLGGIYLSASNGHVLSIIHDKDGTLEGPEESIIVKINPDLLKACKAKPIAGLHQKVLVTGYRVTVAPDFDMIGAELEQYVMPGRALVFGNFPDVTRVIPNFAKLKPGMNCVLKAEYLALFDKVAGKNGRYNGVRFWQENSADAVVVQIDTIPEFLGVVMPMRADPEDGRQAFDKFPCRPAPKTETPAQPSDAAPPASA